MFKTMIFVSLICVSTVLTACSAVPITDSALPTAIPTQILTAVASLTDAVSPAVANNIQNKVSEILGVPVESIQFRSVQAQEWSNGCLGLPEPDEACTEAIVPGCLVVFVADGQEYIIPTVTNCAFRLLKKAQFVTECGIDSGLTRLEQRFGASHRCPEKVMMGPQNRLYKQRYLWSHFF